MVYLKLKVFSLLIDAVYKSIDHCKNTITTDNNNKNYDYLRNFSSLIIGIVNTSKKKKKKKAILFFIFTCFFTKLIIRSCLSEKDLNSSS